MTLIFLDLDCTVADFYRHLKEQNIPDNDGWGKPRHQWTPENHAAEAVKVERMHTPGFWRTIPKLEDAHHLWEFLLQYKPFILTAKPRQDTPLWVDREKLAWVREQLGPCPNHRFICCHVGTKGNWSGPGRILVDDDSRNRKTWEEAGGIFILHTSAANSISQLKDAIRYVERTKAEELRRAEG